MFPISECSEENLLMTIPLLRSPEWNDGDEIGAAENGEENGIQALQMQHLTKEMALLKNFSMGDIHPSTAALHLTKDRNQLAY